MREGTMRADAKAVLSMDLQEAINLLWGWMENKKFHLQHELKDESVSEETSKLNMKWRGHE